MTDKILASGFLQCETLREYANCALELIGNPVLIMDMNMRVVACTDVEVEDPTFQYMKENRFPTPDKTNDLQWRRMMRRVLAETKVTHNDDVNGLMMLQKVLRINGVSIGQIHSVAYFRPFTEEDYQVVELISDRIALALYHQQELSSARNNETDYLIQYLLDEKPMERSALTLKLKMLGWKLEKYLYVLCSSTIAVRAELAARVLEPFRGANDRIIQYRGYTVAILTRSVPVTEQEMEEIDAYFVESGANCGISEAFEDLLLLPRAFREAQAAQEIGQRVKPGSGSYRYGRFRPYAMLRQCAQSEDILTYVDKELLDLANRDRSQTAELFSTVLSYVRNGRSINKVAKAMNIHPNTVSYRVSRFAELSGIDLGDGEAFLRLAQSLMIMEYADRERFFSNTEN